MLPPRLPQTHTRTNVHETNAHTQAYTHKHSHTSTRTHTHPQANTHGSADEYEQRLKELEGERQTVQEDRLQVDVHMSMYEVDVHA
jgi:hypothetical protein